MPSLRWDTRRASVLAQGSWAYFDGGTWTAQGAVGGSLYGPLILGLRPELSGAVGGTFGEGRVSTHQVSAALRLHYAKLQWGIWAGGGRGHAYDGVIGRTTVISDVGAWGRLGASTLMVTGVPTRIGDSLHHADVVGAWRLEHGPLDIMAFGGWRTWSRPDDAPDATWAGVSILIWLNRHLAIVAGGGTYPVDWAQGLPSGRYVTAGLRLATRRPAERRDVGTWLVPLGMTPVAPSFEAIHDEHDRWILRMHAPTAERVEIMGDFTLWQPMLLERGPDGQWSAAFALTSGVYRMNARIDGGPWGVPPGLVVLHDEFNGAVGMLVIPD